MDKIKILFVIILTLNACQSGERELNEYFPEEIQIKSTNIPIKETFQPVDMVVLEDYYVFLNDLTNSENRFFIYTHNMEFCYSFGAKGNGPNEFIAPRPILNSKKNQLGIYDSGTKKLSTYNLALNKEEYLSEFRLIEHIFPVQNISYVNDSILIYIIRTDLLVNLYSYNTNTKSNVDTLTIKTDIPQKMGVDYNVSLDYYHFYNVENKFVLAFEFINKILIGEISSEGIFSLEESTEFSTNKEYTTQLVDNYLYYLFPTANKDFIFVPYYGRTFKGLQPFPFNRGKRSFDFVIEVYDWDKNPIVKLIPDQELLRICVDEKRKKIYTWNYMKDFDELITYDISGLDSYK